MSGATVAALTCSLTLLPTWADISGGHIGSQNGTKNVSAGSITWTISWADPGNSFSLASSHSGESFAAITNGSPFAEPVNDAVHFRATATTATSATITVAAAGYVSSTFSVTLS